MNTYRVLPQSTSMPVVQGWGRHVCRRRRTNTDITAQSRAVGTDDASGLDSQLVV